MLFMTEICSTKVIGYLIDFCQSRSWMTQLWKIYGSLPSEAILGGSQMLDGAAILPLCSCK